MFRVGHGPPFLPAKPNAIRADRDTPFAASRHKRGHRHRSRTLQTPGITAIAFDKDGTLFDFRATWGPWTAQFIRELATPYDRVAALAASLRFDLAACAHHPDSPIIAGTVEDVADAIRNVLPELDRSALKDQLDTAATGVTQVPTAPLKPLLASLRARGFALGLITNDSEAPARAHLAQAGILGAFDFIAGFDSGHGAKPDPGQLLAFAAQQNILPRQLLMVGDSTHDLIAAEAAGACGIGVLTGYASPTTLAPLSEAVLPDISELSEWLEARNATRSMSQTAMPAPRSQV